MSTISQKITVLVEDAIERGITQGEDLEYDIALTAVPGPGGQPQAMLAMAFTMSAVALGNGHSLMLLLPPAIPGQEEVDDMLRRVVQGLVQTRSQAAAKEMQEAAVSSNGHKDIPGHVSKSGLILPGQ